MLSNNAGLLLFLLALSLLVASIPALIRKFAPPSMAIAQQPSL